MTLGELAERLLDARAKVGPIAGPRDVQIFKARCEAAFRAAEIDGLLPLRVGVDFHVGVSREWVGGRAPEVWFSLRPGEGCDERAYKTLVRGLRLACHTLKRRVPRGPFWRDVLGGSAKITSAP